MDENAKNNHRSKLSTSIVADNTPGKTVFMSPVSPGAALLQLVSIVTMVTDKAGVHTLMYQMHFICYLTKYSETSIHHSHMHCFPINIVHFLRSQHSAHINNV
jgi:hypothetical protein